MADKAIDTYFKHDHNLVFPKTAQEFLVDYPKEVFKSTIKPTIVLAAGTAIVVGGAVARFWSEGWDWLEIQLDKILNVWGVVNQIDDAVGKAGNWIVGLAGELAEEAGFGPPDPPEEESEREQVRAEVLKELDRLKAEARKWCNKAKRTPWNLYYDVRCAAATAEYEIFKTGAEQGGYL